MAELIQNKWPAELRNVDVDEIASLIDFSLPNTYDELALELEEIRDKIVPGPKGPNPMDRLRAALGNALGEKADLKSVLELAISRLEDYRSRFPDS